jgi:hypothetical protein
MDDLRWRDFCLKTKTRPSVAWGNAKTKITEPMPKHGETDDLRWRDYKYSGLVKQGRENWTKYIPGGAVSNLDMKILNESRNLQKATKVSPSNRPSTAEPALYKIIHDLKNNAAKLRGEIQELKDSRQQNETSLTPAKSRTQRDPIQLTQSPNDNRISAYGDMTLEHHLICQHERESKVKRQLGESGEPLCKEILKGTFYNDSRDPCVVDPYRLKKKFLMAPGPGVSAPLGLDSTLRNIKYQEMATQSTTVCADVVQGRFMLEPEGKNILRSMSAPRNYIQANARQASLSYLKLKCDRSKYNQYFPDRASETVVMHKTLNSITKVPEALTNQQIKRSNELLLKLSEKIAQRRGGDKVFWKAFQEIGSGKIPSMSTNKELTSIFTTFNILPTQEDIENLKTFLHQGLNEGNVTMQHFRLRMEQSHIQ